jgi:ATP-dependent Clp protease ATP-binding subunit ClpC
MIQKYLVNATDRVAHLFHAAVGEVARQGMNVLTPEHILECLVETNDEILQELSKGFGISYAEVRSCAMLANEEQVLRNGKLKSDKLRSYEVFFRDPQGIYISEECFSLFERADVERREIGDTYIGIEALILAFFDKKIGPARNALLASGFVYEKVKEGIKNSRSGRRLHARGDDERGAFLKKVTKDLTALAREEKLDPVAGREKETQRLIEILSRRKKNNPLLLGEPGVGKTVIVEGLAQRIIAGNVPFHLLKKRVLSLDVGDLIAGSKLHGEFEERLKMLKEEVISFQGNVILFIDEIHTIVGAGRTTGALDAANILKAGLADGTLQCIGATTFVEFKKFIEADRALERRFQSIVVEEPSIADSIKILKALAPQYERHHRILYSEESVQSSVTLSHRYIQGRSLPDKAIDLLDEAGAAKRVFLDQSLEKQVKNSESTVSSEDIAEVVARATGIPVGKLKAEDFEKLATAEAELGKRVRGQSAAIETVANALRRNRIGLRRRKAPVGSFLFLGPTGVGKTELAKALAAFVLDDESKIIRVDMTEFMERHEVAKLIGSPPGYVGHGEGGQLTERIRRHPYSVVLFDEVEKAHPDIFNLLMQVLDDGRLTDSEGRTVSFENAIVIFTSNIGSEFLTGKGSGVIGMSFSEQEEIDRAELRVREELKKFFRPEFLNRLDETVIFKKLSLQECRGILDLRLEDLRVRLSTLGLALDIDSASCEFLLANGFDPLYGARPLRRTLERELENKVAIEVVKLGRRFDVPSLRKGAVKVRLGVEAPQTLEVTVWYGPAYVGAERLPSFVERPL